MPVVGRLAAPASGSPPPAAWKRRSRVASSLRRNADLEAAFLAGQESEALRLELEPPAQRQKQPADVPDVAELSGGIWLPLDSCTLTCKKEESEGAEKMCF